MIPFLLLSLLAVSGVLWGWHRDSQELTRLRADNSLLIARLAHDQGVHLPRPAPPAMSGDDVNVPFQSFFRFKKPEPPPGWYPDQKG